MTDSCEIWFYHLERTGQDQALPELLEKTLARGWKALVRTISADRADHLDASLWTYRDDSFLTHGLAAEAFSSRQSVLITAGADNENGAEVLFLVDGAEPLDLVDYARCIVLFNGADAEQLALARRRWSEFKAAGRSVSYWKQAERGWEKQG